MVTPETINLGLGEPDMAPPSIAVEAMADAARQGFNKYGPSAGIPELRQAIAFLNQRNNPQLQADNILVTPSGTSGLLAITQAFLDPGDEALVPDPGFVLYEPHTILAGAKPRFYGLTEGDFQPDMDSIAEEVSGKTRLIYVNNPSNPTGSTLSQESYRALCDLADDRGIVIVADEVYDRLVYEGEHRSFIDQLDKAVVVNSFSKTMAAPGWRIGYVAADQSLMADL
ncbi:MAG: pyridoxal phosphate-dependent aminotransferase, partial [Candidatus Methanomethylophilaceae archaeon]